MSDNAHRGSKTEWPAWLTPVALFVFVGAASIYFVRLHYMLNDQFPLATLDQLMHGDAYRPFQYRVLVPWMARGLTRIDLFGVESAFEVLEVLFVIGLWYAFRFYLKSYFRGALLSVLPFALFLILPFNYLLPRQLPLILPYDLSSVFFITLGLALLRRRQWWLYYPVFILGLVNRETMVLLALILVLDAWPTRERTRSLMHAIVQVCLWLGIRALLAIPYGDNPGSNIEWTHAMQDVTHFATNWRMLQSPVHLLLLASNFGFLWLLIPPFFNRIDDRFTKVALIALLPVFCATMLFGNINEIRLYGELTPIILVPILMIIRDLLRESGGPAPVGTTGS